MFYGEVKRRQGWWTTIHPTKAEASQWVTDRICAEAESVNPILAHRVRPVPVDPLPPPQPYLGGVDLYLLKDMPTD